MRRTLGILVLAAVSVASGVWRVASASSLAPRPSPLATRDTIGQAAQAPGRDAVAPRTTGTARIRGRVLAADTGAPVRRAIVRLSAAEMREPRSKMTDADGKYEFADLPAGTYSIIVSKTGFLAAGLGAGRPEDMGRTLKLGEGERATADDVTLNRACAIVGRVVDDFGDPVANAQVNVFRYRSIGGTRRMMTAAGSSTNDIGQFRAYGLQPGTYFVAARAGVSGDTEVDDRTGYAVTYYPGTANPGEAQPIQVVAGQDVTGIEIMLTTVRVARVAGIALDSRGRPAVNGQVMTLLAQSSGDGYFPGAGTYGRVMQDGSFTIAGVPPGDYFVTLLVTPSATGAPAAPQDRPVEFGRTRIAIGGSDVTGLSIQASPGATVSGQVVFEGATPPSKTAIIVTTLPGSSFGDTPSLPGSPPARVAEDGTFTISRVFGERLFRVSGLGAGWALKAVYVGGRDTIDTPIAFEGRENVTGVQVVVSDRITHLTGSITDESGKPAESAYVVVLPDDFTRMTATPGTRYQRNVLVRPGTPLKIDGLPPGGYFALAFKSVPQEFDPFDTYVFESARKLGAPFSLRDGETKDVTLKLTDPPAR